MHRVLSCPVAAVDASAEWRACKLYVAAAHYARNLQHCSLCRRVLHALQRVCAAGVWMACLFRTH
jgi:transposase